MNTRSVPSAAALCTVKVSPDLMQRDTVLSVVLKLAPVLQVTIELENKQKDFLSMTMGSPPGRALTQRNAVLRAIAGPALHGALDKAPFFLLGGFYDVATSVHGTSQEAALNLGALNSWMSVADQIRRKKVDNLEYLLSHLNHKLTLSSFLLESPVCSLVDLDMVVALVLLDVDIEKSGYAFVNRWIRQALCVLGDYAIQAGVDIPGNLQPKPVSQKMLTLFYGTEDVDTVLSMLYKDAGSPCQDKVKSQITQPQNLLDDDKQTKQQGNGAKQGKKQENSKKEQQPAKNESEDYNISALDIRVGKIIEAWYHPEADKLFCEKIDLGNGEIRQIASGLRPFYKQEDLQNRHVLVLCNLKSRSLVGFSSHGMVLCASNSDHTAVEFVVPPEGSELGERVLFEGFEKGEPETENKIAKKKIFEKLAPDLKTDSSGQVVWQGKLAKTKTGIVRALNGMPNAKVS